MDIIQDTKRYYSDRAIEYDKSAGYLDPKSEIVRNKIKPIIKQHLKSHDVLEIACGTGYWTKEIAKVAKSVLATDISTEMLEIAKQKLTSLQNVNFKQTDAYLLNNIDSKISAVFSHWWISHIPRSKLADFFGNLHNKLQSNTLVFFIDHLNNSFFKTINHDGTDRIEERILSNKKKYQIVKNFLSEDELRNLIHGSAKNINFFTFEGCWYLLYNVI